MKFDYENIMSNINKRIYGKYIVTSINKIGKDCSLSSYIVTIKCLCGTYTTSVNLLDLYNKGSVLFRHMKCRPNLENQQYNYLTILKCLTPNMSNSHDRIWECKCKCGKHINVHEYDFLTDNTTSCGCYQKHLNTIRLTKHGISDTRLHIIWKNMKSRCGNKNHPEYNRYDGRGITVCEEWKNSAIEFISWAMLNGYKDCLTIDRIDNNKGYYPDNCRWVDYKTQQSNKSTNVKVNINNEWFTITQLAMKYGLRPSVLFKRIKRYKEKHPSEELNQFVLKLV